MKKLLLSIMALAAINFAEAKKVKFQVDMTGQTVGVNGVHIAGDFQAAAGFPGDWQPGATALSNGGTGNVYSVIVDVPANTFYRFKFINGNDWPQVESVPVINQKGHANNGQSDDNRWWYIDSIANDTSTLPAIMFGGSAPSGMFAVRFAVDMQKEATVSANGVHIAGSVQNPAWNPASNNMTNLYNSNKVYEYIAYLAAGAYEFKYVNGNDWNAPSVPENVPSGCQVGGNRGVTVAAADITLDKVCFGSCIACPAAPIPTYKLNFIVDMSNSDCDGGYDSVTVTGAGPKLTSFGSGFKMMEIGTTKLFVLAVDSLDSGEVKFKFRFHKNGNTNWEGGSDRIFNLSKEDTIELTCFGLRVVGGCAAKPAPSSITFKVDLTNETPGIVYVMGTFQTPNWQGGALRMNPVSGEPGIFSLTVDNVCPGSFNYKFINGDSSVTTNEENFPNLEDSGCVEPSGVGGWNRKYTRTSANPVTLYYVFNTCTEGSSVGVSETALNTASFKVYPNPAKEYAMVEFNDNAASHTILIMDIAGRVLQSYNNYKQNSLLINLDEMNAGIYFIKASNTRNESVSSKLIVR
jgi:hypothetical protein